MCASSVKVAYVAGTLMFKSIEGQPIEVLGFEGAPRVGPVLISIVVPVFNEEQAVPLFVPAVRDALSREPNLSLEFVFVNDGSTDGSLQALLQLRASDSDVCIIDLSRNFGKEAALTAGLDHCSGDIVVPMDVDLQDPPSLLPAMIEHWRNGFDVVLARRTSRKTDSFLKRWSAAAFYRMHNLVSEPEIVENVGDFRLMDRAVIDALRRLPESRRFMKGLFAWVGFRSAVVDYERPIRSAGSSKFNGWRLWNLAIEGVTSFTTAPLRVWSYIGGITAIGSFAYGTYLVLRTLIRGIDVPGYASVFVAVMFLGGLQLVGIGVIGEYLGRTYIESKGRPTYITRRKHLATRLYTTGDSRSPRREPAQE
jgi:glycosyltransferase involved in cell wall biosynthesis